MQIIIFLCLLLCSILFSLSDLLQSKSTNYNGTFGNILVSKLLGAILVSTILLILYFIKKPLGPLYLPSEWNYSGIIYGILDGLSATLGLFCLGFAFYYNSKLENPVNVGILTSILSLGFVFTIIMDIIINVINKKPIHFSVSQGLGLSFIIAGIVVLSR